MGKQKFNVTKKLLEAKLSGAGEFSWYSKIKWIWELPLPLNNRHPMMRSVEGWNLDGGDICQQEWVEEILPFHKVMFKPEEYAWFPASFRRNFRDVDEVWEVLEWHPASIFLPVIDDSRLRKYLLALEGIAMFWQMKNWNWCICEMIGAAMTTYVAKPTQVAEAREGFDQFKIMALSLDKERVEEHVALVARGLKNHEWIWKFDMARMRDMNVRGGWNALWNTVSRWRRLMTIQILVIKQCEAWVTYGKEYIESNQLPPTALIGRKDFINMDEDLGDTVTQGRQMIRYMVPGAVQKPMEELLLCAYWESTKQKRPIVTTHGGDQHVRSLLGLKGRELTETGLQMFTLGQYNKAEPTWGIGGQRYWQVYLEYPNQPVVQSFSMLAQGPGESSYSYRRNDKRVDERPPSKGMQLLLDAGLVRITEQRSILTEEAFAEMELPSPGIAFQLQVENMWHED